jgi:hypothetical protein
MHEHGQKQNCFGGAQDFGSRGDKRKIIDKQIFFKNIFIFLTTQNSLLLSE